MLFTNCFYFAKNENKMSLGNKNMKTPKFTFSILATHETILTLMKFKYQILSTKNLERHFLII